MALWVIKCKKMTCWPFFCTVPLFIYVRPRFEKINYLMQTVAALVKKKLVYRTLWIGTKDKWLCRLRYNWRLDS